MADYVATARQVDELAAAANAAAIAMNRAGDAADKVDTSVTRATTSAERLKQGAVDGARETAKYETALRNLASVTATMDADVSQGNSTLDERNAVVAKFEARVQAAKAAMDAATGANDKWSASLSNGAQAMAAAIQRAEEFQDSLNKSLGVQIAGPDMSRAADIEAYGQELDRVRARFDPVFAASKQYESILGQIADAEQKGAISADIAAAAFDRATGAFAKAHGPATEVVSDAERIAQAVADQSAAMEAAAARAASYQETLNRTLGITAPTGADDYAKRAEDIEAYGQELDRLRAKFDPVFAASQRYESALNEIVDAERKGAINAETAAAARDQLAASYTKAKASTDDLGASTGQAAFAARQLEVQFSQAISGIATGQGVFTVLAQQGHQVADVMLATGTSARQLGQSVLGMLGPLGTLPGLLTVGVVGAMAAAATESEVLERRMLAMQTSLRTTRDDFASMASEATAAAKAVAANTGFSLADTTTGAKSIAAAPQFQGTEAQLETLLRTAGDLATVLGEKLPAESARFAAGMRDPAKFAADLTGQIKTMDAELSNSIKLQADGGDKAGAFGRVIDAVRAATSGATDQGLTPLQRSLRDLGSAFTKVGEDGQSLASSIGGAITGAAALAIDAVTRLVNGIESLRTAANHAKGDAVLNVVPQGAAALTPDATGRPVLLGPVIPNRPAGDNQAVGMMQVLPSTAASFGLNPYTQDQNILAGLLALQKFGGTSDRALALYGGYGGDVSAARDFINNVRGLDPGKLPPDIATQIEGWGQSIGGSPDLIRLGQQLALHESGGHQYGKALPSQVQTPVIPYTPADNPAGRSGLPNQATYGAANRPVDDVNDALTRATNSGVTGAQARSAKADIDAYTKALAELSQTDQNTAANQAILTEALGKAQQAYKEAVAPVRVLIDATDQQAKGQDEIAAAWERGAGAASHAENATKAETVAYNESLKGKILSRDAIDALTDSYDRLTKSQHENQADQQIFDQGQQLQYLQAELSTLGESADVRARDLAVLKQQQAIDKDRSDILDSQKDKLRANAAAIADAMTALQHQQQVWTEIGNFADQFLNSLSSGITSAFLQGSGAAINWASITKSAVASVVTELGKLAIVNPILNVIGGGDHRTTIGDVFSAIGGSSGAAGNGGGSGSSSGNALGALSTAGSAVSGANTLSGGWLFNSLGLTGDNGLLSGIGRLFGSSGGGSSLFSGSGLFGSSGSIASFLNTPLWGQTALYGPATAAEVSAAGSTDAAIAGLGVGGGTTIGSLLGGFGGGFGLGSLAGGFLQSSLGKIGPAPTIGAGIGAAAGLALTPVLGPFGPILGGILGGAGGGLIGPKPPSAYSSTGVSVDADGMLQLGNTVSQLVDTSQEMATARAQVDQIDAILAANNVKITSLGALTQVGQNTPGGFQDPSKFGDINSAFSGFRFTSADADTNKVLSDRSFSGADELQAVLTSLSSFLTDVKGTSFDFKSFLDGLAGVANSDLAAKLQSVDQFVTQTVPALEKFGQNTGSLQQSIDAINAQFGPAVDTAKDLGYAVDDLSAAWKRATDAATASANQAAGDQINGFIIRADTAAAQVSGDPAAAKNVALWSFDRNAWAQETQLDAQLVATFGDSVRSTKLYADSIAALEKALGEERLATAKQYDDQIAAAQQQTLDQAAQAANSTVTSISSYLRQVEAGDASPLAPKDQYDLASRQFDAVAGAAQAGDFNSTQQLTSFADALLSASRDVNGSGTGYVSDFDRVTSALDSIVSQPADTLTVSAMASISRTQTQTLQDALDQARGLLDSLNTNGQSGTVEVTRRVDELTAATNDAASNIVASNDNTASLLTALHNTDDLIWRSLTDVYGATANDTAQTTATLVWSVNTSVYWFSTLNQTFIAEIRQHGQMTVNALYDLGSKIDRLASAMQAAGYMPARLAG